MRNNNYSKKLIRIIYFLTLRPHVVKLCRLTYKIYLTDTRQTKTSLNRYPYSLNRSPYRPTHFLNIDELLIKSNYPELNENTFFLALASLFHQRSINVDKMGHLIWVTIQIYFLPYCITFYECSLKLSI